MKIERKYILNGIFLIIVVVSLILLQRSTNQFEERLLLDGKFAIGTFDSFGYAYKGGGRNYKYSYDADGRIRNVTDQRKMPNSEQRIRILNGDQFLVLYNNEGESIFFDKPIHDSTDYNRYIQEFEELRKKKIKH